MLKRIQQSNGQSFSKNGVGVEEDKAGPACAVHEGHATEPSIVDRLAKTI